MKKVSSGGATLVAIALLVVPALMVVPSAPARAPELLFTAPYDVRNEVTGFDLDAQGRYAAVAVNLNPTAGGTLGDVQSEYDVYLFNLDSGIHYRGRRAHSDTERLAYVSTTQTLSFGALTGQSSASPASFVVGGPSGWASGWDSNSDTPRYDSALGGQSGQTAAAALSPDGRIAAFGTNDQQSGRLHLLEGKTINPQQSNEIPAGRLRWSVNVSATGVENSKITTLAFDRTGKLLVVGHEKGVFFIDPSTPSRPTSMPTSFRTIGKVTSVDVSRDGMQVVVGTDNGANSGYVYFFARDIPNSAPFNRGFSSPVRAVTISLDGAYFAAGTASGEVHFFERGPDASLLAQTREDRTTKATKFTFTAGNGVTSLDYDSSGAILVAATGSEVAGIHSSKHEPIWRSSASALSLDTPLKGARVSDTGERVLVVGKSKVTALRTVYEAVVEVPGGRARTTAPGDTVRYDVSVKNTGSAPDTYAFQVSLPAGGWSVQDVQQVSLLPDESTTVKVNVTSPSGTPPGHAIAKLNVESLGRKANPRPGESTSVGAFDLNLTVTRVHDVRIEADERDIEVNQGQDVVYAFTVRNLGNADAEVNLSAIQSTSRGPSWRVRFDPEQVTVAPGATATGTVTITPPQDAYDGDTNTITLRGGVGSAYHANLVVVARVNPVFSMDLVAEPTVVATAPGKASSVTVTITNNGNTPDVVNLSALVQPASARLEWKADLDYKTLEIARGASREVTLTIRSTVREPTEANVEVVMTTVNGKETRSVSVQVDQDPDQARTGFWGRVPAPSAALLLAMLGVAALIMGPRSRER